MFEEVLFAGGYEQSLKALVAGQVDAAAASDYALERYVREADRASIRVLHEQGPVPTHVLAWRADLDPAVKQKVRAAFLALNKPENRAVLEAAYGAVELAPADNTHLDSLAKAIERTQLGTDLASFKK